jgi:hypothetical protein
MLFGFGPGCLFTTHIYNFRGLAESNPNSAHPTGTVRLNQRLLYRIEPASESCDTTQLLHDSPRIPKANFRTYAHPSASIVTSSPLYC